MSENTIPEESFKETASLTIGDTTICVKLSDIEYIIIEPDRGGSALRSQYNVIVKCKDTKFCIPIAYDYGGGYKTAKKAVHDLRCIWDRYLNKGAAAQASGNDSSTPNSLDSINPILSLG